MVFFRRRRANPPRTYIDLMFQASNQYANFDPSKEVNVGDIGVILRDTGKFDKLGNIYDDKFEKIREAYFIDRPKVNPARRGPTVIASMSVSHHYFAPEATADIGPIAEASFGVQVSFNRERGVVLVMNESLTTTLDCSRNLKVVLEKRVLNDVFKEKKVAIVTEVTKCSQYAFIVGQKGEKGCSIELKAVVPTPAPGIAAGGGGQLGWSEKTMVGQWHTSSNTVTGDMVYTPLMELRMLDPRSDDPVVDFRAPIYEPTGELPTYYPPWDELDSDGEEMEEEEEEGEEGEGQEGKGEGEGEDNDAETKKD